MTEKLKGDNHTMITYNKLNSIEKAICDEVTKTWYTPNGVSNPSDFASMFLCAHDSIETVKQYENVEGISTLALTEAIVSRYNYGVYLNDNKEREA